MTVYGVFHNPCYHESAAALLSLHATKHGAYKAYRAALVKGWTDHRNHLLTHGKSSDISGNGEPPFERWFMRPIEVQP